MSDKLTDFGQNSIMESFSKTDDIVKDMREIIESSRDAAYKAVNTILVQRNWLIGYRIAEEGFRGGDRAEYGANIIGKLSKLLTAEYGKGFTKTNLYNFYSFYKEYPEIFQTLSGKSSKLLSWSHYAILLQVNDRQARAWYEKEAAEQTWSVRTLQRNVSSQYYFRMLKTQNKENVEQEMKQLTSQYQSNRLEFIKNPVITELFYNYILKCFVLIDLKTEKVTHQDVGQMDMYIRMYDELKRSEGDNPTIGIVLCSDTDEDIARYSIMHGNEQLFASKYKLYLPTEEELKAEIENQKMLFYLQQGENKKSEN